ncbi:hypothetical protein [Inediibacterium massiliense]|uniref:hypothetical protein n=1 Tax=Inediibacterium massiliense TaxID=1658111 RepID=UPI0018FE6AFC|nr:hypothetical protein [Inediibacterium massiliense]
MFFRKREKKISTSANDSNKNQNIAEIIEKKNVKQDKISNLSDEMIANALKNLLSKK